MMPARHRTFFPPSPPKWSRGLAQWEVVSSYSSATAPDSHGISCADPLFQARKELRRGLTAGTRHCKNYLFCGDESPTQGHNRAVGCQRLFLLCQCLKDRVAFLTRCDCAGDVSEKIRRVLFNHTAENLLKLRADLRSRVQLMLMILSPRSQGVFVFDKTFSRNSPSAIGRLFA